MRAPNHVIGGLVFTGIFGSFLEFNVLGSYPYFFTCVFASLLPDIDYPGSWMGRLFYPLAKQINRRYGHRTITHSLGFFLSLVAICGGICSLFGISFVYTSIFAFAYFSHLLFDMMTIQGVPLLYPFLKNRFVLPGRPDLRLNSRDLRSELVVFCLFGLSLFFMKDLFSRGFWTSYNRQFGTIKHLHAEFVRSPQAIEVSYEVAQLSEHYSGTGILLDCDGLSFTVLDDQVHRYDAVNYHFSRFEWRYSDSQIFRDRITFQDLPSDSLELLLSKPVINLKVRASAAALWQDNADIKEGRYYSSKFNNDLVIDCDNCLFSGSLDHIKLIEGDRLAFQPHPTSN